MEQIIQQVITVIKQIMMSNGLVVAIMIGLLLIISESIIPILPLALFIAINNLILGKITGFIVSYLGTVIGCILSFYLFRFLLSNYIQKKNLPRIHKFVDFISSVKLGTLTVIMAIPFTPAFSINIGAGLSKIPFKKFLISILISKVFIVYFWGYVGTTLVESLTDVSALIKIFIMLVFSYAISVFINKKFNLD